MCTMTHVFMFASTSSLPVATRKSSVYGSCTQNILSNSCRILTTVIRSCTSPTPTYTCKLCCQSQVFCFPNTFISLKWVLVCLIIINRNCDVADYLGLKYMCNKFLLPRTLNCIPFAEAILVLYDATLLLSIATSKT